MKDITIVFVHSALFTGNSWLSVQTFLTKKGYHTLSLDTSGRLNDGVAPEAATLPAAANKQS